MGLVLLCFQTECLLTGLAGPAEEEEEVTLPPPLPLTDRPSGPTPPFPPPPPPPPPSQTSPSEVTWMKKELFLLSPALPPEQHFL